MGVDKMRIWNLQAQGWVFKYGIALLSAPAAIGLRYALMPLIGPGYQYVTVFPAILIVAILAGRNPAILAAVLGSLTAAYYFEPTLNMHALSSAAIVIATGVLTGHIAQRLHNALAQSEAAAEILKKNEARQTELKDNLADKVKELESIISVISHDLRAPLLNIRGFNKVLKEDGQEIQKLLSAVDIPADAKHELDRILNQSMTEATGFIDVSAKSMNNLIESLVKVARAGLVVPNPELLDMNQLVKDIVDSIRIKFKNTGTRIDVQNLPACFADKTHVTQIFTNLLDNAIKYLDQNRQGEICVEGIVEKDHVLYWVSDNGIGIAHEDEQKIFDMYYQVGDKAAGGQGVGLATVKRLVERNNGRVWVVCDKDKGCNFFIALHLPLPGKSQTHR